jgi:hypothetical protein
LAYTATSKPSETPKPSKTATQVSQDTVFHEVDGPHGGAITTCENTYTAVVTDVDGIANVKIQFSVNDPNFKSPISFGMVNTGGDTYAITKSIDTHKVTGEDTVYWRLRAKDNAGNFTYHPEGSAYAFTDPLDCGAPTDTPTTITILAAPENGATVYNCDILFKVNATDDNGISHVKVQYSINAPIEPGTTYFVLDHVGGDTYKGHLTFPVTEGDTVYWRIWVIDGLSNSTYKPESGSRHFIATLCPPQANVRLPTAAALPRPSLLV